LRLDHPEEDQEQADHDKHYEYAEKEFWVKEFGFHRSPSSHLRRVTFSVQAAALDSEVKCAIAAGVQAIPGNPTPDVVFLIVLTGENALCLALLSTIWKKINLVADINKRASAEFSIIRRTNSGSPPVHPANERQQKGATMIKGEHPLVGVRTPSGGVSNLLTAGSHPEGKYRVRARGIPIRNRGRSSHSNAYQTLLKI
jgi:hypothetical protein